MSESLFLARSHFPFTRGMLCACGLLVTAVVFLALAGAARAVTPESPEVIELINSGLKFLETKTSDKLGGKCLTGLCFLKTGKKDHPRVAEALAACQKASSGGGPEVFIYNQEDSVYSNAIAIIFLCELDARRNADLVRYFLEAMKKRQKADGSWGYNAWTSGDTSQTQYGALAYWEAHRRGFSIDPTSVEKLANWLRNVQDPSGGWGYQGVQGEGGERVAQKADDITCSRVSASIGSALICADLFGLLRGGVANPEADSSLPTALQEANLEKEIKLSPLKSSTLDSKALFETIQLGDLWMEKNYKVSINHYTSYYMYALERYKSFQELQTGIAPDEPDWYNKGYEHLKQSQKKPGVWETGCQEENDTAFSILFLMRSTQKAIRQSLGEGTLLVGRGMPANLSRVKLKDGQLVVEQTQTQVSELLNLLDDDRQESLDALLGDPTALVVTNVDEASGRRLQQVIRAGSPEARVIAARALGRTGKLDYVPSLIYALTDPDRRVVREADAGLRFISRKFAGVGLPERFNDKQRYDAIDRWKTWYRGLRPDAQFLTE